MTKKTLNEAQFTLSMDGLESTDADTLSQILSLAGQAEDGAGALGGDMGISPVDSLDIGMPDTGDDFISPSASDDMSVGMDALDDPMDAVPVDVEFSPEPEDDMGVPGELGADPVEEPMDVAPDEEFMEDDDDCPECGGTGEEVNGDACWNCEGSGVADDPLHEMNRIMELSGFDEGCDEEMEEEDEDLEDIAELREEVDFTNRPDERDVSGDLSSSPTSGGHAKTKPGDAGEGDNRLDTEEIDESYNKMMNEFEEFVAEKSV